MYAIYILRYFATYPTNIFLIYYFIQYFFSKLKNIALGSCRSLIYNSFPKLEQKYSPIFILFITVIGSRRYEEINEDHGYNQTMDKLLQQQIDIWNEKFPEKV